jgi:AraC-type transcriptional regulator N-terminus
VAAAGPDLLDAVIRMLVLLDSPRDRPVLAPMLERAIVWRLLTGPLGATVRQFGLADSSVTQISRAVRWITEHHAEPFRVDDVATVGHQVGYDSASQFNREYRRQFGQPPGRDAARLRGEAPGLSRSPTAGGP